MADNKESTKITRKDIHHKLWEARDFEISHLWQRSIFLATFIVLLFTAYFSVLDKAIDNKKEYNAYSYELSTGNMLRTNTSVISYEEENLSNKKLMTTIILEGICLMGFSFSTLWVCMARGSKYMYERIENGINTTYDDIDAWDPSIRAKIEKEYCDCLWNLGDYTWMPRHGAQPLSRYNYKPLSTDGSTFSPSRINIIIGYVFMLAWMLLAIVPIILFISCSIISIVITVLLVSLFLFFFISYWSLSGKEKKPKAFFLRIKNSFFNNDKTLVKTQVKWIQTFLTKNKNKEENFKFDTPTSIYILMHKILANYSKYCGNRYITKTIAGFLKPNKNAIYNMLAHEQLYQIFEISIMPRKTFNQTFIGHWVPQGKLNSNDLHSVQIKETELILKSRYAEKRFNLTRQVNDFQSPITRLFADTDWQTIICGEKYDIIQDTKCFTLISKNNVETTYITMDITKSFSQKIYADYNMEIIMNINYTVFSSKEPISIHYMLIKKVNEFEIIH